MVVLPCIPKNATQRYLYRSRLDNRGTPAPKGAAWRKIIYGTVGDLSSKDQAAALRALAARHPFIDRDRVGIVSQRHEPAHA